VKKFHEFSLACGLRSQLTNVRFAALCEFRFTTGNVLALTMAAVTQRPLSAYREEAADGRPRYRAVLRLSQAVSIFVPSALDPVNCVPGAIQTLAKHVALLYMCGNS